MEAIETDADAGTEVVGVAKRRVFTAATFGICTRAPLGAVFFRCSVHPVERYAKQSQRERCEIGAKRLQCCEA